MKTAKGIFKNLINIVIVGIMVAILFSVMAFCWLADAGNTFVMNFNSSTASAYFAGGNGSKEEPYQINTPVHMYNFAWLQYLGYFNLKDGFNNGRAQSFFELTGNINMSSIAIPPIGTREYPFIGYFNGNGNTVYNVTVSNYYDDLTRHPSSANFSTPNATSTSQKKVLNMADSKNTNVDIVGLFGVTGDFNSFISTSKYSEKKVLVNGTETPVVVNNKQASTGTTTSNKLVELPAKGTNVAENEVYYSGMSVNNLYIDKITVNSVSSKTLVGLAAGYVSSSVQNVGVYRSKVSVDTGTSGGVSNVTTVNGTAKTYGTTISKYSVVGDYDEDNVGWSEVPTDSSGDSTTFGGSIDMRTLNRRVNYMQTKFMTGAGYSWYVENSSFGINAYKGSSAEYDWKAKSTSYSVMYLTSGTVLPLNVDKKAMGLDSFDVTTEKDSDGNERLAYEETNSNNGLHYNRYYKNNDKEIVLKSNTGYLVGGGVKQNGYFILRKQPLVNGNSDNEAGIFKSLGYTSHQTFELEKMPMYNKEAFEMLTITLDGKTYRIKDGVNGNTITNENSGFKNDTDITQVSYDSTTLNLGKNDKSSYIYESVRNEFDSDMEGSYMAHGFHFLGKISSGSYEVQSNFGASIYGKNGLDVFSSYQFVEGGLNFTVAKSGSIRAVLGTYYTGNYNSIFDLYKVNRKITTTTGTGGTTKTATIQSIEHIKEIYKDSSGNIVYNPTDTTGLTQLFSFNSALYSLRSGAAYYFEIPVSAGDYVIGAQKKDDTTGESLNGSTAYLMYLDIGANGDGDGGDTVELPYTMQTVDFVSVPTGFDDNGIIETIKTTDSSGNTVATYPAYKDVGFTVGSGTDTVYYKRKSYDSLPSADGEIDTVVYFWRLNSAITVTGVPSSHASEDKDNAYWEQTTN